MTISAAVLSIASLTSGCVVNTETPQEETQDSAPSNPNPVTPSEESTEDNSPIASTITTTTGIGQDLQVDVHALERLENDLLRLRIGITNNSSKRFSLFDGFSEDSDPNTASGITLIDANNQKRYLSYDQSSGECFCSTYTQSSISSGGTAELWVIYPEPPSDLESMTITTPLTPPLLDVPISTSPESVKNENLADAEVLDLSIISDNLEDQTGRTESGEEVSIILSSDVLFETNSSELSSNAQEILEQVATEIDDTSSEVVNIDGHADNTGSESINIPLSQERAEAVESALVEMINRDVTFKVEGHGASDPIADNDTEEGRERNRRVSVTFEK